jgi:hypothetical protein
LTASGVYPFMAPFLLHRWHSMPDYRCYLLDDTNRIVGVELQDCADDDAIVNWGLVWLNENKASAVEIWDRGRLVHKQSRLTDWFQNFSRTPALSAKK